MSSGDLECLSSCSGDLECLKLGGMAEGQGGVSQSCCHGRKGSGLWCLGVTTAGTDWSKPQTSNPCPQEWSCGEPHIPSIASCWLSLE